MGAEIKIYQSLWKNLLLVICCVIFAIGAIFIIADDSCKIMTKVCGGWLGVIFFGGGGLFICVTTFYNSIRHIPYLILYKDRVEIYVQFKGTYKVVKFEDVKFFRLIKSNHSIFRHDNFIGCFSADKIKMSARKYFCFNIPVYKNMAEESSCRSPYHEEYIQTSVSGNPEDLYRSTYSFLSGRR